MVIAADYPFMDVFWSMIIFFFWVIWIWIVVTVLIDIFRRDDIGGWAKAAWVIFVVILPWLGVLIYLIVEHDGMRERSMKQAQAQKREFDDYVRDTAGGGSAGEIAKAKELLDSGAITQEEFAGAEGQGARVGPRATSWAAAPASLPRRRAHAARRPDRLAVGIGCRPACRRDRASRTATATAADDQDVPDVRARSSVSGVQLGPWPAAYRVPRAPTHRLRGDATRNEVDGADLTGPYPGASGAAGGVDARRWRILSSNPAMSAASTPPPSATIQTFEPSLAGAGVAALGGSTTSSTRATGRASSPTPGSVLAGRGVSPAVSFA